MWGIFVLGTYLAIVCEVSVVVSCIMVDMYKTVGSHSLFVSCETELRVLEFLVERWSWKSHLLVTLWKTRLCTFIVQVSGRESSGPFSLETELQDGIIVLVARWSLKGHFLVTLGKLNSLYLLFRSPGRQS